MRTAFIIFGLLLIELNGYGQLLQLGSYRNDTAYFYCPKISIKNLSGKDLSSANVQNRNFPFRSKNRNIISRIDFYYGIDSMLNIYNVYKFFLSEKELKRVEFADEIELYEKISAHYFSSLDTLVHGVISQKINSITNAYLVKGDSVVKEINKDVLNGLIKERSFLTGIQAECCVFETCINLYNKEQEVGYLKIADDGCCVIMQLKNDDILITMSGSLNNKFHELFKKL